MTQIQQQEIMKHDAIKLQTSHLVWSNRSWYGPAFSEQRAPSVRCLGSVHFNSSLFTGWEKKSPELHFGRQCVNLLYGAENQLDKSLTNPIFHISIFAECIPPVQLSAYAP